VSGNEVVTQDFVMTIQAEYGTTTGRVPSRQGPDRRRVRLLRPVHQGHRGEVQRLHGCQLPDRDRLGRQWYHGIDNLAINFEVSAICVSAS
jgi:hypothetical protein